MNALGDDGRQDDRENGDGAPGPGRPALQSVGIALDIIDALARAPELSLSELARRVGVAKSTAHRTCAVLARRGFVDRTAGRRYRLGLRLVEYGDHPDLAPALHREMQSLLARNGLELA